MESNTSSLDEKKKNVRHVVQNSSRDFLLIPKSKQASAKFKRENFHISFLLVSSSVA